MYYARKSKQILSDDDVRAIRLDPRPTRMIADIYGISIGTVYNVKSGWARKEVV